MMTTFDITTSFFVKEMTGVPPHFLTSPTATSSSPYTLTLASLALEAKGTIYACILPSSVTPKTPSSAQIVSGVDFSNLPCNRTFQVAGDATPQSSDVTELAGGLNYWVYFSATNTFPRFPDELADSEVVAVSARVVSPAATGAGTVAGLASLAVVLHLV